MRHIIHHRDTGERGFVLIYAAVFMTMLLLFLGLALDTGRAYVVKAQLTKAVDGAALGAARMLNGGDPRGEAARIFNANFPTGYMGTSSVTNPLTDANFFRLETDEASGVNIISIDASAIMPTSFMRLAAFDNMTVRSRAETRRRMVDISLVLDVSGSLGSAWPTVRDAARQFVRGFDPLGDRFSLVTFSHGARVEQQMPASRGFDLEAVVNAVPQSLPGGFTNIAEGIYRGWDELRAVSADQQSGLRVMVVFTDGSANGVSGLYAPLPATGTTLHTGDWATGASNVEISGLFDSESVDEDDGPIQNFSRGGLAWNSAATVPGLPFLPAQSAHVNHRSIGIPEAFPFESELVMVDGETQIAARGLVNFNVALGLYPAQVININNAARNLTEIIAREVREDRDGAARIRIYTIGMGALIQTELGTSDETSESILMRIANDMRSPDYTPTQLEGRYYRAETPDDVAPAFQAIQAQIVRLTQ